MRTITLHVDEATYGRIQEWGRREGRSAAALIREAMTTWLLQRPLGPSLAELEPVDCGRRLSEPTREELFDEMIGDTA